MVPAKPDPTANTLLVFSLLQFVVVRLMHCTSDKGDRKKKNQIEWFVWTEMKRSNSESQ